MGDMLALWDMIQRVLFDSCQGGEWYAAADLPGKPFPLPEADPWKTPYHNGRICMELMKRL